MLQKNTNFINITSIEEKKDLSGEMANSYDPEAVESAWYDYWMKEGLFKPNMEAKEKFTIVIPPPNITGSLHLGHALTNSVQDAIVRWHRMKGHCVLWVPGTDHAGIATQVVVEKKLQKEEGKTRHDIGREEFIDRVWNWKGEYGGKIIDQLKKLGSSLDWDHEVFTMDENLSKAVNEAFVRYHEKGLIYRSHRLVNWCTALQTAISDIEVQHVEFNEKTYFNIPGYDKPVIVGFLFHFAYKIQDCDKEIVVATTRPETMLGDTAVAVHPEDKRYKDLHGKFCIHPFIPDRKIPIIADATLVDMNFGTGAVKVTPAHDLNDYETGKRHGLEFINILNLDGTLNSNAGSHFEGVKRMDARTKIMEQLESLGLARGIQDNKMSIGICSRSRDIIEPYIMPQWWVDTTEAAQRSIDAVKNGELKIIPEEHEQTWFRWLKNIQPWCISRQLWWGHRIPAYKVIIDGLYPPNDNDEAWIVGRTQEEAMVNAIKKFGNDKKITLEQDPDVLDTWFSSGLFPFSVFGWPDNTKDLETFYPTSLLETGKDILFFWVARMVMMAYTLTDKLPFTEILLHPIVRDAHGKKMSKSTGNVIDPIDVIRGATLEDLHKQLRRGNLDKNQIEQAEIGQKSMFPNGIEECGADALRFALCAYMSQGRDINLDINRVVGYRHFCNKMWNVVKFAMANLGNDFIPSQNQQSIPENASIIDRWMISRIEDAIEKTNQGFENYSFETATTACFNLWLYDLADNYIEAIKPTLWLDESIEENRIKIQAVRQTLFRAVDVGLRLIHPFMPFITEELWQRLPKIENELDLKSISIAPFPSQKFSWRNEKIEQQYERVKEIVHRVRSMRGYYNIPNNKKSPLTLSFRSEEEKQNFIEYEGAIKVLSFSASIEMVVNKKSEPGCAIEIIENICGAYVKIKDLVNIKQEIEKLERKIHNQEKRLEGLSKKMSILDYEKKVPEKVREANHKNKIKQEESLQSTKDVLKMFQSL